MAVIVIPARAHSVGVRHKNLQTVGGRTLVARAVDSALTANCGAVIVSSDSLEILDEAQRAGAICHRRRADLARDNSTTVDVVLDVLSSYESDHVALVQPTSPFVRPATISRAIDCAMTGRAAASVTRLDHPLEWSFWLEDSVLRPVYPTDGSMRRRQEYVQAYRPTGGTYALPTEILSRARTFLPEGTVGIAVSRLEGIDIDDYFDLRVARTVGARQGPKLALFGLGGHGRSMASVLQRLNCEIALCADPRVSDTDLGDVVSDDLLAAEMAKSLDCQAVVAVGDGRRREALGRWLTRQGVSLATTVALSAVVAESATLGAGSAVMEFGYVGPRAVIGPYSLVNTGAIIEHDVALGVGVSVGPGAVLAGAVACANHCLIGANCTVLPGIQVGAGARVGAGSTVVQDVPAGATVVGSPARPTDREVGAT